jgi:hypothetical protein
MLHGLGKMAKIIRKYDISVGDRRCHLEQLLYSTLSPKVNGFQMKIENQIWTFGFERN